MASPGILAFLLVFGGFGLLITLFGVSSATDYVRMRRRDQSDNRSVRGDMTDVELSGTANPVDGTLTAPLTGADVLAYDYEVRVRTGDDSQRVEDGAESTPFVLDDGTGEILVDPEGAQWSLEEQEWYVEDGEEPPEPIRRFLDQSGQEQGGASEVLYNRDRWFTQETLEPGEDAYVYGPVNAGPHEKAPHGAVDAYVGTDTGSDPEGEEDNVDMRLTKDLLPGVGDPEKTLLLGGTAKGSVFTVADTGEKGAQRRMLKKAIGTLLFGLLILAIAIGAGILAL